MREQLHFNLNICPESKLQSTIHVRERKVISELNIGFQRWVAQHVFGQPTNRAQPSHLPRLPLFDPPSSPASRLRWWTGVVQCMGVELMSPPGRNLKCPSPVMCQCKVICSNRTLSLMFGCKVSLEQFWCNSCSEAITTVCNCNTIHVYWEKAKR